MVECLLPLLSLRARELLFISRYEKIIVQSLIKICTLYNVSLCTKTYIVKDVSVLQTYFY